MITLRALNVTEKIPQEAVTAKRPAPFRYQGLPRKGAPGYPPVRGLRQRVPARGPGAEPIKTVVGRGPPSTTADERHRGGRDRHELNVRVQRQLGHEDHRVGRSLRVERR